MKHSLNNKKDELTIEDFELIHILVTLYFSFAIQSGLSDSALDIIIKRLQLWDFDLSDDEKGKEILKVLNWFSKNYDETLFSKFKNKFNELSKLSEKKRKVIVEDIRMISVTFFQISSRKIQLYNLIVKNLRLEPENYKIEIASIGIIEAFNNQFDVQYKSMILDKFCDDGYISLLSIDIRDLKNAIAENDFSESMLQSIGKVELGDWDSLQKLTSMNEGVALEKEFKDGDIKYLVVLYCQGNYVYAFSSE